MNEAERVLTGRFALVTGSSRGLGERIARVFWQAGASLCLAARSREDLERLAAELRQAAPEAGQSVSVFPVDLLDPAAPEQLMQALRRLWGKLDILVNNAAIQGPIGPVEENSPEEWSAALQVNLLAAVRLCQIATPWMRAEGWGRIINLSGGGATGARPNFSAYAVSKTGLVRFSEILAAELQESGVTVNCVAPGAMNTRMMGEVLQAGRQRAGSKEVENARRVLEGGDAVMQRAAQCCLYLASPRANGITGKLISAVWDPWETLDEHLDDLRSSDLYTLRRIVPAERGKSWG